MFTLNSDDFDALRQLIHKHCGIWLDDSKVAFLQGRLAERMRERNISLAQEYYFFLKYDPHGDQEMQQLIDAVTVNETWFFRETGPLQAWREVVLPELVKCKGWSLRLWSAGCASGEEPYTLAMLLLDAYPAPAVKHLSLETTRFDILATDISRRALKAARAGVYDPYSLRHTDHHWLTRYFNPASGGWRQVCANVRQLVRFDRTNLVDPSLGQRVQGMDVILCRNVIIYFDDQSRQAALANFYAALKPGGYLLLGHSESLLHTVTPFEVARVGGTIMYRKRET